MRYFQRESDPSIGWYTLSGDQEFEVLGKRYRACKNMLVS